MTPLTTKQWAERLVTPHVPEIARQVRVQFLAHAPKEQRRILDHLVRPGQAPSEAAFEETEWALLRPHVEQITRRVELGLEEAIYRACQKQGCTDSLATVMERARHGDTDALLTVLAVFPDAEQDEPFRTLAQQARRDPDFLARWRALPRRARIHGSLKKHLPLLVYLSLNSELVRAHAARALPLQRLIEQLDAHGLEPPQYQALRKFLHRHFADLY